MTILALSAKDQEFLYQPKTAHAVSKTSAGKIRDALNNAGYKTTPDSVWYIHEVNEYDNAFYYAEYQRFTLHKNGRITETR